MRFIPTRFHAPLDYIVGVALIAAPWIFQFSEHTAATVVPIVLGIGLIVYSLFTNYELGIWKVAPMAVHNLIDIAAGALLVLVSGGLLVHDRGRNGHPSVATTRLLLAFPALVGLGSLVGGVGLAWHAALEREVLPAAHMTDDLIQAAALLLVGTIAYVPSWRAFRVRTAADSAVRRFYLFTVVCLALVGGLVSSVIVVYNAITVVAGISEFDAGRTALTWVVPALTLAAIFVSHLTMLVRDQRQTRATEVPPADPLLALLEDVRAGRVSVAGAAAAIRGRLA